MRAIRVLCAKLNHDAEGRRQQRNLRFSVQDIAAINCVLSNPASSCNALKRAASPLAPCGMAQPLEPSRPTRSHHTSTPHGPLSFVSMITACRSSQATDSDSPVGRWQTIRCASHVTMNCDSGCNRPAGAGFDRDGGENRRFSQLNT